LKITYLFIHASATSHSSVQAKVINQITAARNSGTDMEGWFFTTDTSMNITPIPGIHYIFMKGLGGRFFQSWRERSAMFKEVYRFVSGRKNQAERYYMRFAVPNFYLLKIIYRIGNKLVFNHVSAETKEIKLYKSGSITTISRFLSNLEFKWIPILNDYVFGFFVRRNVLGGVVNSHEIARHQQKLAWGKYKTMVIGDGVDVSNFTPRKTPDFNGKIAMFFLKGASSDALYNGIDRLIKGMLNYTGNCSISLTIYGSDLAYESRLIKELHAEHIVTLKPFLSKKELDAELDQYHLGIGQLAVHRKGLKSNTTIKTREYFARGIPFIYAHHDIDISESPEAIKFCLQFPADESCIDLDKVEEFLGKIYADENVALKMNEFAKHHLDYVFKMKKIVGFVQGDFN
jgi:hypothetical protein